MHNLAKRCWGLITLPHHSWQHSLPSTSMLGLYGVVLGSVTSAREGAHSLDTGPIMAWHVPLRCDLRTVIMAVKGGFGHNIP